MLQARTISRGAILTLIALTAALIILLMSGCSSDEPTPTSQPDPTRSALIQEIDRQSEQIADLQRTVEELERSKTNGEPHRRAKRLNRSADTGPTNPGRRTGNRTAASESNYRNAHRTRDLRPEPARPTGHPSSPAHQLMPCGD